MKLKKLIKIAIGVFLAWVVCGGLVGALFFWWLLSYGGSA